MKLGKLLTVTALATGVAFSVFVDSAEAFPFGSRRYPQAFGVDFDLGKSGNGKEAISNVELTGFSVGSLQDDFTAAKSPKEKQYKLFVSDLGIASQEELKRFFGIQPEIGNLIDFNFDLDRDGFDDNDIKVYNFSFDADMLELTKEGSTLKSEGLFNLPSSIDVAWYVPSKFIYQGVKFDLFLNSDPSLLPDENNLAQILTVEEKNNISSIVFPSDSSFLEDINGLFDAPVEIDTLGAVESGKVPEADTLASILILGSLGAITRCKRRIK